MNTYFMINATMNDRFYTQKIVALSNYYNKKKGKRRELNKLINYINKNFDLNIGFMTDNNFKYILS